jgi:signal transduction histidine kinase
MHAIALVIVNGLFLVQYMNFDLQYTRDRNEMATVTITYSIIYFILNYATIVLKTGYDKLHRELRENNLELHRRANEIEAQNEELVQIQENIHSINSNLESIVNERTAKIQLQNEVLLRYSYTNAHHLRGPVARLLGLANVYRLESSPDTDFIIRNMVNQAIEIDQVVRQINIDLESGQAPTGR